jgi:predicted nuclease of predicted toxin-antitoxin system
LKFKLDENLPQECASILRQAGHLADSVVEEHLSGTEDSTLIEHCKTEERILVSLDLDFAGLRAYPPDSHPGIIGLRPATQEKHRLIALMTRLLIMFLQRSPANQLWIVDERKIRVREK